MMAHLQHNNETLPLQLPQDEDLSALLHLALVADPFHPVVDEEQQGCLFDLQRENAERKSELPGRAVTTRTNANASGNQDSSGRQTMERYREPSGTGWNTSPLHSLARGGSDSFDLLAKQASAAWQTQYLQDKLQTILQEVLEPMLTPMLLQQALQQVFQRTWTDILEPMLPHQNLRFQRPEQPVQDQKQTSQTSQPTQISLDGKEDACIIKYRPQQHSLNELSKFYKLTFRQMFKYGQYKDLYANFKNGKLSLNDYLELLKKEYTMFAKETGKITIEGKITIWFPSNKADDPTTKYFKDESHSQVGTMHELTFFRASTACIIDDLRENVRKPKRKSTGKCGGGSGKAKKSKTWYPDLDDLDEMMGLNDKKNDGRVEDDTKLELVRDDLSGLSETDESVVQEATQNHSGRQGGKNASHGSHNENKISIDNVVEAANRRK